MKRLLIISLLICNSVLAQSKRVDPLSFMSLKIDIYKDGNNLGSATGFVVLKNNKYYLITNLHVVTGRDYYSKAVMDSLNRIPNLIGIWHNANILGNWIRTGENLYKPDDSKRWIECEYNNKVIDLVALPLSNIPNNVKFYPFSVDAFKDSLMTMPGFPISIIGFPYGMSSYGRFAIWKTGHIASDVDLDSNELPVIMIDATTKPGMSGSIVVIRQPNYLDYKGNTIMGKVGTSFIGVYSSQSDQEEIGYVWKPVALQALIDKLP